MISPLSPPKHTHTYTLSEMRTRFLGLDFFNSSAPIEALDDFLRFPVPDIPAPPPSFSIPGDKNLFDCIDTDDVSILSLSSQLQSVQIDTALSKFYDDVLPHRVEVDQCCFPRNCSDEVNSVSISFSFRFFLI